MRTLARFGFAMGAVLISAIAQAPTWEPYPDKAAILVINPHPDDEADLATMQGNLGQSVLPGSVASGDADGDGSVTAADLALLFEVRPDLAPTPEPSGALLMVLSVISAVSFGRTRLRQRGFLIDDCEIGTN